MARSIRSATLETRTARLKLPVSGAPVFVKIGQGIALGYRRNRTNGAWVARLADGKGGNTRRVIGLADDYQEGNGEGVLDYWQACNTARRLSLGRTGPSVDTVGDALKAYSVNLKMRGKDAGNVSRILKHLPESLAGRPLTLVTSREWERWRDALATKMAAASVNRTCRVLRAALNAAADHDRNLDRQIWRVGLAGLPDAERSRNVILDSGVIRAMVAAAYGESEAFGLLVETAAQTGGRVSHTFSTRRAGWLRTTPRNAALTVPPVAIPLSTTITVRPSTATRERFPGYRCRRRSNSPSCRCSSASISRPAAARRLAAVLVSYSERRPIVLALLPGGVPVGFEVAKALAAPVDVLLVCKIGAPDHEELGLGAVVDGHHPQLILNEDLVRAVAPAAEDDGRRGRAMSHDRLSLCIAPEP